MMLSKRLTGDVLSIIPLPARMAVQLLGLRACGVRPQMLPSPQRHGATGWMGG